MRWKLLAIAAVSTAFTLEGADWISVPEAPVCTNVVRGGSRAMSGTSWFAFHCTNANAVVSARWTVSGLGVFEVYVNGRRVGTDFLKPGFTHPAKTKYAFSYDVSPLMRTGKGEENVLTAEVSSGWWRDKIVSPGGQLGFTGKKSAFRGELELTYGNGSRQTLGTNVRDWKCGLSGPVLQAAIFDGEEYDARMSPPLKGEGLCSVPEVNGEFAGELLPTAGAEVCLRRDLAMKKGPFAVRRDKSLIVDFGQNCAAVPEFVFRAKRGTVLTVLPGEMLNDADKGVRGCDGPKGSVYRANLRCPDKGMRIVYTFAGKVRETYLPRFTYFGYRYLSISATDDVEIESVTSIPVSSVTRAMETGRLEVGDMSLNRFIRNVYWGQLSNYLSVPTDCPQRNERLGWCADTQVFCEAGSFNADTRSFFRKFTRDLRDSQGEDGGYPSVAPFAQYGNETFNFGWADAGVIVPWTVWRQFGDLSIVRDNFDAMAKFVRAVARRKYDFEAEGSVPGEPGKMYMYADWLSYERFETCGNRFGSWKQWKDDPDAMNYRRYLAACYWLHDARILSEMAEAIGRTAEAEEFARSFEEAIAYIRSRFVEADGLLLRPMRDLQTACIFALRFGIVVGEAKKKTLDILLRSIANHDGCLQTGFLGTSFLMDVLAAEGEWAAAYGLLFQHKNPSWLYSVDQGATTVWERWNSYTKKDGFGPAGMNSFNHYAYGAVLAWIYKHAAGIAADPKNPGFKRIIMAPKPDRRLGFVKAEYRSVVGLIKSAWRYEGERWIWDFTIPNGATASVVLPGGMKSERYEAGTYRFTGDGPGARIVQLRGADISEALSDAQQSGSFWAGKDFWNRRHAAKLKEIAEGPKEYDFVFLGDSITHNWEGWSDPIDVEVVDKSYADGKLKFPNGPGRAAYAALKREFRLLNLGVGGDATQHVLWRLDHGEMDGYRTKGVMLMIGTNNNESPSEVAAGIRAILAKIAEKQPEAQVLLLPIFPCGATRDAPRRRRNDAVNVLIRDSADGRRVHWCDFNDRFLEPGGELTERMMPDLLHPLDGGYRIWAESITPKMREICGR